MEEKRKIVEVRLKNMVELGDYIGKTQRYVKTCTKEHVNDVWKVIDSGRKKKEKYGWDNW